MVAQFSRNPFLLLWTAAKPTQSLPQTGFHRALLIGRKHMAIILAPVALNLLLGCSSYNLAAQTQHTIWSSSALPSVVDSGPDTPVELGVSFKSDTNGYIAGIRFYKSSANTGTHIVSLWTNAGVRLASATSSGESASGWQQVNFAKPVAITANTVYVASYHTVNGHWSVDWYYFASAGKDKVPLHALSNASGTPDGRFTYGNNSAFPTSSHNSANYWVDVAFAAGAALQITTGQLLGGTVGNGYKATLTATGGTTPYTWSVVSGTLPPGLILGSQGTIAGAPSAAGSFSFHAQVKDAAAHTASSSFTLQISPSPSPTIVITSPPNASTASGTITISGRASDVVAITAVQLAVDGGAYANAIGSSNWSFMLDTSTLTNGSHVLNAKVTDVDGMSATSSVSITAQNNSGGEACTLYASPSGNDSNAGTSPSAPRTFTGAAALTQPGSVVCFLAGTYNLGSTFYPPTSGSPSSWIVYKDYGDGAVNIIWAGGATGQPMFKFGNGNFPSGAAYLEFRGLDLDGQNNALDGFFCYGSHHLRFINNVINNTGGSGIGAVKCDYLLSNHNLINHNGYLYGWTSAISYNTAQWFDSYAGFHNIASNNIIAGEYDGSSHHTDGNGIILDLGSNTPPALVVNNVVYGNGGRCIQANGVTNFWFINNTCYKNNLDPSLGNAGSLVTQNSGNGYFVNNIAQAVQSNNPSYDQEGTNSGIYYYADMYYGAPNNFIYPDPSQLINEDPQFLSPPALSLGGYATALAPAQLGDDLTVLSTSPAYNRGIDPSALSGLPVAIVADLKKYIYTDITGKSRPQGGCDLGAYQH
jgi:hypothetical protein